jgi:hypothetical protein
MIDVQSERPAIPLDGRGPRLRPREGGFDDPQDEGLFGAASAGTGATICPPTGGHPHSFGTRFENEKGTNPEELIAAAHAGCFRCCRSACRPPALTPLRATEAAVTLEPEGQGFRINRSAITLRAKVPKSRDSRAG